MFVGVAQLVVGGFFMLMIMGRAPVLALIYGLSFGAGSLLWFALSSAVNSLYIIRNELADRRPAEGEQQSQPEDQ